MDTSSRHHQRCHSLLALRCFFDASIEVFQSALSTPKMSMTITVIFGAFHTAIMTVCFTLTPNRLIHPQLMAIRGISRSLTPNEFAEFLRRNCHYLPLDLIKPTLKTRTCSESRRTIFFSDLSPTNPILLTFSPARSHDRFTSSTLTPCTANTAAIW